MATQTISRLKLSGEPLSVTVVASENWSGVTSIDFGGADVLFSGQTYSVHPFSGNTNLVSISNCNITNSDCTFMFGGCSSLSSLSGVEFPNLTIGMDMFIGCNLSAVTFGLDTLVDGEGMFANSALKGFSTSISACTKTSDMFYRCYSLQTFSADCQSIVNYQNMFNYCSALTEVQMVVPYSLSGLTQTDFNIPSTAPSSAYRYVDDLGDNLVRLVFTNTQRSKYTVRVGSDRKTILDGITVSVNNNNTTISI